jgi:hypothetical protein
MFVSLLDSFNLLKSVRHVLFELLQKIRENKVIFEKACFVYKKSAEENGSFSHFLSNCCSLYGNFKSNFGKNSKYLNTKQYIVDTNYDNQNFMNNVGKPLEV